jgi:hypothetical protein
MNPLAVQGSATSIPLASFTLLKFAELTPGMAGASRAELFRRLATSTQLHGLQELDERIRAQSDRLFAESQRDDTR